MHFHGQWPLSCDVYCLAYNRSSELCYTVGMLEFLLYINIFGGYIIFVSFKCISLAAMFHFMIRNISLFPYACFCKNVLQLPKMSMCLHYKSLVLPTPNYARSTNGQYHEALKSNVGTILKCKI